MAVDLVGVRAALDAAANAITRAMREIDSVNNPVASGDYSDLGLLTRGVQPGSPEAEAERAAAPVSAITHGAADMAEASGGTRDNEGNPTGSTARSATDTSGANRPAASGKPADTK